MMPPIAPKFCAGWCEMWKNGGCRIAAGKTISFQNGA